MTVHNEAKVGEIAKTVIMPGDPLRAKMIAETYLENPKLVNTVRNIFAYTGTYKGKPLTVMASGMGMPSMGIYCYELYKFYGVESIIRVGSCGAWDSNLKILDTILVENSYTEGNFAYNFNDEKCDFVAGDKDLLEKIMNKAYDLKIPCIKANAACAECFDIYTKDPQSFLQRSRAKYDVSVCEMEAFALYYVAKVLGKKAACLLTVVDICYKGSNSDNLTSEDRQKALHNMIKIALESAI